MFSKPFFWGNQFFNNCACAHASTRRSVFSKRGGRCFPGNFEKISKISFWRGRGGIVGVFEISWSFHNFSGYGAVVQNRESPRKSASWKSPLPSPRHLVRSVIEAEQHRMGSGYFDRGLTIPSPLARQRPRAGEVGIPFCVDSTRVEFRRGEFPVVQIRKRRNEQKVKSSV